MLKEIKKQVLKHEELLNANATRSKDSERINAKEKDSDLRTAFSRDIDRIVHSKCYSRYINKTQVYSNRLNDHISTRSTHVQFVSRVARQLARTLGYNEDLCEAIALGHDVGHVPFGHVGEEILSEISLKYLGVVFAHNVQSVRNLMVLENNGLGLNLSAQVLDGILCHNGEFVSDKYYPVKKTKESFLNEYESMYTDQDKIGTLIPMTIEGCIVRLSDIIAYVGKDIEDACMLNKFSPNEIEKEIADVVGTSNRHIMNNIIIDVINESYGKDYIKMSDKMYNVLKRLKSFNYQKIYTKALTYEDRMLYRDMFSKLFLCYLKAIKENDFENDINKEFLCDMCKEYLDNTPAERKVIDYLAGMTDAYITRQYEKYILK